LTSFNIAAAYVTELNWCDYCAEVVIRQTEGKGKMTDASSAMGYSHWLLVAGAILVVLGFIGLAFRQRLAPVGPTEIANEQGPPELKPEIAQAHRKAKLAEQTKSRWANKDRGTIEELPNDRPKLSD
jgi:hypothetical protein